MKPGWPCHYYINYTPGTTFLTSLTLFPSILSIKPLQRWKTNPSSCQRLCNKALCTAMIIENNIGNYMLPLASILSIHGTTSFNTRKQFKRCLFTFFISCFAVFVIHALKSSINVRSFDHKNIYRPPKASSYFVKITWKVVDKFQTIHKRIVNVNSSLSKSIHLYCPKIAILYMVKCWQVYLQTHQ